MFSSDQSRNVLPEVDGAVEERMNHEMCPGKGIGKIGYKKCCGPDACSRFLNVLTDITPRDGIKDNQAPRDLP